MSLLERNGLPVRPSRQLGESLPGYLYRLYNANGHPVPTEIHASLSLLYSNAAQDRREAAAAQLSAVTGELSDADWPRWRTWHGWLKQSYAWLRFCPLCLRENQIHQSIWELPLAKACPIHQTQLVEECECGRKLGWRWNSADWQCRCGKAFSEIDAPDAAQGTVVLARLISACSSVERGGRWPYAWRLPKEFHDLSLEALYAEIAFLHQLECKLHQHLGGIGVTKFPSASVGMLLARWPRNLDAYLQGWLERYFAKDHGSSIVRLGRNMPLIKLKTSFSSPLSAKAEPNISRQYLARFVDGIRLPMHGPGVYLIDPALLKQLDAAWLHEFYALTERSSHLHSPQAGKPSGADSRQAAVIRHVIARFVAYAVAKQSFNTGLRRTARIWPALPEHSGTSLLEWLAHLIGPLHEASHTHLCYLREALDSVQQ